MRSLSLVLLAALALSPAAAASGPEDEALGQTINRALHADGPFFTPAERALIERECGYAAGQYDGFDANISNGVFTCSNGRRVDDPEMRAMLRAAEPRIAARVRTVMRRPEIRAAIDRVADAATAQALQRLRERRGE